MTEHVFFSSVGVLAADEFQGCKLSVFVFGLLDGFCRSATLSGNKQKVLNQGGGTGFDFWTAQNICSPF